LAHSVQFFLIQLPAFLFAICFHEFMHGWVAKRYGDLTAEESGRLTLNPLAHLDVMGSIVMPLLGLWLGGFLFGWAKPVPIRPQNFKHFRRGLFWVSFAGPLANLVMAAGAALLYGGWVHFVSNDFFFYLPLKAMLEAAVFINLILALFNLLPLPPLDGSKMVQAFLPLKQAIRFEQMARFGFFILIALAYTGVIGSLLEPARDLGVYFLKTSLYMVGGI